MFFFVWIWVSFSIVLVGLMHWWTGVILVHHLVQGICLLGQTQTSWRLDSSGADAQLVHALAHGEGGLDQDVSLVVDVTPLVELFTDALVPLEQLLVLYFIAMLLFHLLDLSFQLLKFFISALVLLSQDCLIW